MSKDILVAGALSVAALILAAVATVLGPLVGTMLVGVPVALALIVYALKNTESGQQSVPHS